MALDLLSDVLTLVRLTGALIFRLDIHGPWGIAACPTVDKFASLLPAGTNHVLSFHVVLEGECWIRLDSPEWMRVTAGEAVVIARGDAHEVADRPGRATLPLAAMLHGQSVLDLRQARFDTGAGSVTSVLCGFLGCDRRAFEPLFNSLPPMFKAEPDTQHHNLVQFAIVEALDDRPGAACLRVRLAELLFMGALRSHMQNLPADATGAGWPVCAIHWSGVPCAPCMRSRVGTGRWTNLLLPSPAHARYLRSVSGKSSANRRCIT